MQQHNSAVIMLCGGEITPQTEWRSGARIDFAVELAVRNGTYLMVSSGISGHTTDLNARPESHIYIEELRRRYPAFPLERLLVEDFSRDTVGNVYFSLQVLKAVLQDEASVTWVSNEFHKNRLMFIIEKVVDMVGSFKGWSNTVKVVPDTEEKFGKGIELESAERASLARFKKDLEIAKNVEELLFCFHDFYSIKRILLCS